MAENYPRTGTGQAQDADPYRCEIKENSQGKPSVSVRATDDDSDAAVEIALAMYYRARRGLNLE